MNSTRQIPEYVPRLIKFDAKLSELCSASLVLTPNNRLAEVLKNAFIQFQIDSGLTAWQTPQIHSFDKFTPGHYAKLQHHWPEKYPDILLSMAQQKLVWLSSSAEVTVDLDNPDWHALAKLAMDSWSTLHEWCIDLDSHHFQLNDSSAFYQNWARAFKARLRKNRWITTSEVPDVIRTGLPQRNEFLPSRLLVYGFENETRQQTIFLDALETSGLEIVRQEVNNSPETGGRQDKYFQAKPLKEKNPAGVFQMPDEASELEYVARWSRQLVEKSLEASGDAPRLPAIGIIVPDLERRHAVVVRQFDSVFSPASVDADPMSRSFNISGGVSLNRSTVCSDALQLLRWTASALSPEDFEGLRSSPYLNLAGMENVRISRKFPLSMAYLNRRFESGFLQKLFTIEAIRDKAILPLSDWSSVFSKVLELGHWPVPESLESVHFQAAERLSRLLEELQQDMDIVGPCDLRSAVRYLESVVVQIKYSPQSSEVPVQIMTALEADGLSFDYMWMLGFHNRAWPANPASKPFIPRSLLLEQAVPRSNLESELEFARRYIGNLLEHSDQVSFSFAQYSADEEFEASKLIETGAMILETISKDSAFHPLAESCLIHLDTYNDFKAPAYVPDTLTKGGSGLLTDQSSCPFLALANYRLHAGTRPLPDFFPNASDRGNILHRVLENLFTRIKSHEALSKLSTEDRKSIIQTTVASCVSSAFSRFPVRFQETEIARLENLVEQWLQVELQRAPFRVDDVEVELSCNVAGLQLNTRVDRIDMDEESGRRIIIDYKTGKVRVKDWGGERPGQPQLPLYALQSIETGTLFYAQVRDTECKYAGMSETYPTAKTGAVQILSFTDLGADDWGTLRENWHTAMNVLSNEFQAGYAEVSPASINTCKYCNFQSLCRISAQEKLAHD